MGLVGFIGLGISSQKLTVYQTQTTLNTPSGDYET
jgi:hypothetical protein